MDGATLQGKIYRGYAKAAQKIGQSYNLFRPVSAAAPLGNQVGTVTAALDSAPSYGFKAPNEYGDATWFALVDDATTQAGDYLINGSGAYFIAGKQFLLPVIVVECNRSLRISRQAVQGGVGAVGYGGLTGANESVVLGAANALWPASILLGGRSQKPDTKLPSDAKQAGWRLLLPPSVPVVIMAGDIAQDDLGRRYMVDAAELTDLGWRLSAQELHG